MLSHTAEDLMIPLDDYPHIPYWFTIREAIAMMHHSEIEKKGRKSLARAVLVFDEEYNLLGMARRRDILSGLNPERNMKEAHHSKQIYEIKSDPDLLEMSSEALIKNLPEMAKKQVGDIMRPLKQTLNHDDHIMTIIYEMNETQMSMLPVLKDGVVAGVVRTVEVMNEIAKILGID